MQHGPLRLTGHELAYIHVGCQTVPIFCLHFLGHRKKSARSVFNLVMPVGVPVRILLSRTVSRRRRCGKTQGIENPVQESECNKNLMELLACSVRTGETNQNSPLHLGPVCLYNKNELITTCTYLDFEIGKRNGFSLKMIQL